MKISVIGAGAMGGSLVEGLLKGETFQAADITVADPYQPTLDKFAAQGTSVTTDNKKLLPTAPTL
jgi:pyrroline-5-carboxylate reductase